MTFDTIENCSNVYIYGTGSIAADTFSLLCRLSAQVSAFLERAPNAKRHLDGLPLYDAANNSVSKAERKTALVMIAIFNPQVDLQSLKHYLADAGWSNILTFNQYFQIFSDAFGDRYWLTQPEYYEHHSDEMQTVRSLWKDEKSRAVHDSIAEYRVNPDPELLQPPDLSDQYFPSDVPGWPSTLDFVDCGAFDGDTIRSIRGKSLRLRSYVGFEPDAANYKLLVAELKRTTHKSDCNALAVPCATYDETCQLRFQANQGAGSSLTEVGDTVIQCVAIDAAMPNFPCNLIKMDIEGAEIKSLLGAEMTIRQYVPALAICVYHHPAHIWEIPLLINSWNLGYRFFLRCHCFNSFDLVMYAVPPESLKLCE
jgi:FkbM family methyltransferase